MCKRMHRVVTAATLVLATVSAVALAAESSEAEDRVACVAIATFSHVLP